MHRPGTNFLRPGGKVSLQAEHSDTPARISRFKPGSSSPIGEEDLLCHHRSSPRSALRAPRRWRPPRSSLAAWFSTALKERVVLEAVLGDIGNVQRVGFMVRRNSGLRITSLLSPNRASAPAAPGRAPPAPFPAPRRGAAPPCRRQSSPPWNTSRGCFSTLARSASASSVLIGLDVRDRIDLTGHMHHIRIVRNSAPRARWRRSRGCWRGTCCRGPRPSKHPPPVRRCRRTRPPRGSPSNT